MYFTIQNETKGRLRIRVIRGMIGDSEAEVLRYVLTSNPAVRRVDIFPATGGIAIAYSGERDALVEKLRNLQYGNVTRFARQLDTQISAEEIRTRKLTPELKRRLRARVLLECAADVFLPMPVQIGYHVYQLITLKDLF